MIVSVPYEDCRMKELMLIGNGAWRRKEREKHGSVNAHRKTRGKGKMSGKVIVSLPCKLTRMKEFCY